MQRHRNTETGKLHPRRHQVKPWELLVLPGLRNAEAGEMASNWNEPQAGVSEQLWGQAGPLWPVPSGKGAVNQLVSPVPAEVLPQHPATTLARLRRGVLG